MALLDLPDELLAHIAATVHFRDLLRLQQVCTRLHDMVKSNAALQYVIELHVAGRTDNPVSRVVPGERLRILRAKERGWRELDLSDRRVLPLHHSPSGIYDLTGGVLLLGERRAQESSTGTDSIYSVELDSAFRDGGEQGTAPLWSQLDLGKQIIDVGLAFQEHDLIAAVTYSYTNEAFLLASVDIHLVQLSTGQPHPAAAKPVLHFDEIHYLPGHCSIMLEVSGDSLCFLLNNYFPFVSADPVTLVVFNWKTGHPKVGQKRLYSDPTMFNSFVLLSHDTAILPIIPTNSLEICHFAEELATPIPPPEDENTSSTLQDVPLLGTTCALELPPLRPGATLLRMTCRCEPNPRGPSVSATRIDTTTPFFSSPDTAVMILHVHIRLSRGSTLVYTMIVHRTSLLKIMHSAIASRSDGEAAKKRVVPRERHNMTSIPGAFSDDEDDSEGEEDEEKGPVTIPWSEWGPAVTRWFQDEFGSTRWITKTCGQRFVRLRNDGRMHVYDFNQLALQRYMHEREMAGSPVGSRDDEEVCVEGEAFLWDASIIPDEEDEMFEEDDENEVEEEGSEEGEGEEWGDLVVGEEENADNTAGGEEGAQVESLSVVHEGSEEHAQREDCAAANAETVMKTIDPERRVKVMLGQTIFSESEAWDGDMVSSLPYIETSMRAAEEYESLLVDEDIIVGLKMTPNGRQIKEVVLHRIGGPSG